MAARAQHQAEDGNRNRGCLTLPSAEIEMIKKRLHASGLDQQLRVVGI